jgi:hypothetical protein
VRGKSREPLRADLVDPEVKVVANKNVRLYVTSR